MSASDLKGLAVRAARRGPYKFLDYYEEADQAKFAGRSKDVQEIVARATTGRSLVLYGRSGLGKTSLLLAGVFPQLRKRGFQPVYARTLESPLNDVREAFRESLSLEEFDAPAPGDDFVAWLKSAIGDRAVVLVLDQFEEFFIRFADSPKEREHFIATIGQIAREPELDLRIVFSLREDYLANLDEFREDFVQLFSNEYRLLPLTAFGARQAIVQPLVDAGIRYESSVVSRLVDLLAQENFDPVLLQIVCTETYFQATRRSADVVTLEKEDVDNLGRLENIFERYINLALSEQPSKRLLVLRAVLDALITFDRTKRAVTRDSLDHLDFTASREEISEVLALLEELRLIRREHRGKKDWIELTHDRIVEPLLKWIDEDREFFGYKEARNLINNASQGLWRSKPELLLTSGHLDSIIRPYEDRIKLDREKTVMLVHSAIRSGSSRFPYWAERLEQIEPGSALAELEKFLDKDRDAGSKLGALAAIEGSKGLGHQVADKILLIALEDEDPRIRSAAGRALRQVGNDQQMLTIREALRGSDARLRLHARELAAQLVAEKSYGSQLTVLERWRANRRYRRNQREEYRLEIAAHRRVGAWSGMIAGLAWVGVISIACLLAIVWVPSGTGAVVGSSVGLTVVALLLSPILGWFLAARAGKFGAYGRAGAWLHIVGRSPTLFVMLLIPALFAIYAPLDSMPPLEWAWLDALPEPLAITLVLVGFVLIAIVLTLIAMLLISTLVKVCQYAIWPHRSTAGTWFWSAVAAIGVSLIVPATIYAFVTHRAAALMTSSFEAAMFDNVAIDDGMGVYQLESIAWVVLLSMPVLSFIVFVVCIALATAESRKPVGELAPQRPGFRFMSRSVISIAFALMLAWYAHYFGLGTIPIGKTTTLSDEETIAIEMGPGLPYIPNRHFSRWAPADSWPVQVEARLGDDSSGISLIPGEINASTVRPFIVEEPTTLAFLANDTWPFRSQGTVILTSKPLPTLQESPEVTEGMPYRRVTFERDGDGDTWSSHLEGSFKMPEQAQDHQVSVQLADRQPGLPRELALGLRRVSDRPGASPRPVVLRRANSAEPVIASSSGLTKIDDDGSWAFDLTYALGSGAAGVADSIDLILELRRVGPGEARNLAVPLEVPAGTPQTFTPQASMNVAGEREAWWRWRPPGNGSVELEASSYGAIALIEVYRDDSAAPLAALEPSYYGAYLTVPVESTSEYFIHVGYEPPAYDNSVELVWYDYDFQYGEVADSTVAAADRVIAGDAFENARLLEEDSGEVRASLIGIDPSPSAPVYNTAAWWRIERDALTQVVLSTEGSDFDTVIDVFTNNELLIRNDDYGGEVTSLVQFQALPGRTYDVGVSAYDEFNIGTVNLTWNMQQVDFDQLAGNDAFAMAVPLEGAFPQTVGTLRGATVEPGEPPHAGMTPASSVWYRWEPGAGTPVFDPISRIRVIGIGPAFRPYVAVYVGSALDALTPVAAAVAESSDEPASVYFPQRSDGVYWVAVGATGDGPAEGGFVLQLDQTFD